MVSPGYFKVVMLTGFIVLAIWIIVDTSRRRELGLVGLQAIAGFSIFWQEFYADWGAYLMWNSAL